VNKPTKGNRPIGKGKTIMCSSKLLATDKRATFRAEADAIAAMIQKDGMAAFAERYLRDIGSSFLPLLRIASRVPVRSV
jgi:hypothetical protein